VGLRASLDIEDRGESLPLPWIEPRSPGRPARSPDTILPELTRLLPCLKALVFLGVFIVQKINYRKISRHVQTAKTNCMQKLLELRYHRNGVCSLREEMFN
jgi:hypothetical protein